MKSPVFRACLAALVCASGTALAGPYADDMGKCLVNATSPEDRAGLVRWMFGLMALHPDVQSMASISEQQREAMTKSSGALFQRLLLESCRSEAQAAIQNEGPQTIEYAFQILGQVAMRGLMGDSHVMEGLKDLGKSMDEDKVKALLSSPARK